MVTAMISREREAEILRLWHAEKWKIGTIAANSVSTTTRCAGC